MLCRSAWRSVWAMEQKIDPDKEQMKKMVCEYRGQIEKELEEVCKEVLVRACPRL